MALLPLIATPHPVGSRGSPTSSSAWASSRWAAIPTALGLLYITPGRVVGRPSRRRRPRAAAWRAAAVGDSRRLTAGGRLRWLTSRSRARVRLTVKDVSVRFGGLQALDAVTLDVAPGEVHGLIGPNGAGKTTLFNVITGLQRPTHGRVLLRRAGRDRASSPTRGPAWASGGRSSASSCSARCPPATTCRWRPRCSSTSYRWTDPGRGSGVPAGARRDPPRGRRAERTRCRRGWPASSRWRAPSPPRPRSCSSTSRALVSTRRRRTGVGEVLQQLASEGMGVLLVEHDMTLVMAICARVDVLDNGLVIARGDPATVQADPAVQEAYLGGETKRTRLRRSRSARRRRMLVEAEQDNGQPAATDTAPLALSAVDVRAGYGRIEVLHGISLAVRPGSAMALLGPNGAGKTTLLDAISGQIPLTAGTVEVAGQSAGEERHRTPGALGRVHDPRGPVDLSEPDGLGEPPHVHVPPGRPEERAGGGAGVRRASPHWRTGASSSPARCRAASSGCSPWPGP